MAGSSSVSGGFSGPGVNRKHHGFGRFSLGRLFNLSVFSHHGSNNSTQHCGSASLDSSDKKHSESSLVTNTRSHPAMREPVRFTVAAAGPSSSNSESNSYCSGQQTDVRDAVQNFVKDFVECPLCLFELPRLCFPELSSCNHQACYHCLQQYLKIEITESRINISCPECTEPIHPSDIRMILNDDNLLSKYESFMLRRVLVTEPDARWCPAPDCGYAVIAHGCAGCPKLKCERPGCNTYFCYHCKQEWHPNQTCDAARAQRARHTTHPRSSSVSFSQDSIIQSDDIKPCPCCKVLIIKMDDGSCNHMTCSVCGTEFCWLCMKEISDLHYLSPSGCTFWGKKPWSRKKKIMWQLGMLVGAPVGIALIAGIAVPAIIIGIPVWVGRKLHTKYSRPLTSKHRRNIIVSSGVIASILVSPILAGIAVGIGVPILLAYVYGVVPISLCRSGGCGVSTSASGVRIEFDEENEIDIGNNPASGNFDGASVDTAVSQRVVNPSIGEVSLGMSTSLSLGSGSHLDRIGMSRDRESDRESASNVALAGSIASASLVAGTHKLEIQADVSSNKRFSLSSHSETASATVSLSERSANMSLADDASTKALAGSILGYRDSSAVTPVEVHVDAHMGCEEFARAAEASREFPTTVVVADGTLDSGDSAACRPEAMYPVPVHNGNCSEGLPHTSSTRLKLWKNSKKRKHRNYSSHDDAFSSDGNSASLSTDSYSLAGHVHFGDFKGDCVCYIDESPCSETVTHGRGNKLSRSVDSEELLEDDDECVDSQALKRMLQAHCSSNTKRLSTSADPSESDRNQKLVSRSVSFCNSCTFTHRSCCLNPFHSRSEGAHIGRANSQDALEAGSYFEPVALVHRAYKLPCSSVHDVSIEITANDDSIAQNRQSASADCVIDVDYDTNKSELYSQGATSMHLAPQPYHYGGRRISHQGRKKRDYFAFSKRKQDNHGSGSS